MKLLNFYKNLNLNTENDVFDYLIRSLKPGIMIWSYFVNWEKVFENTRKIEVSLNTLNYLIGKDNFDIEFKRLIQEHPEIIKALPALVVRNGKKSVKYSILVDYENRKLTYDEYDFNKKTINDNDAEHYLEFITRTGAKELFINRKVKNLVDYIIGVEAGLDSNARKNRGGKSMEKITEAFISDFCRRKGYKYLSEANAVKIKKEWNHIIPVDKSSRRYDFIVDTGKGFIIFETNFYGGGGSKLKSTAGEYRNLFDVLNGKYKFVWITDGQGWLDSTRPLHETFEHNEYIFNLDMIENGILEYI